MIIYTCPNCGQDLQEFILYSIPPQTQYSCSACGWHKIEKSTEQIVRIPYGGNNTEKENVVPSLFDFSLYQEKPQINAYCEFCPNHPSNGGNGVCHCILGGLDQIKC